MKPYALIRKSLWSMIPFLEGEKALPMRHVAVLLYILEKKETSSPELQDVFESGQGAISQIISKLAGMGLLVRYPGSGAASRRDMVAPSDKALELGKVLEALYSTGKKGDRDEAP